MHPLPSGERECLLCCLHGLWGSLITLSKGHNLERDQHVNAELWYDTWSTCATTFTGSWSCSATAVSFGSRFVIPCVAEIAYIRRTVSMSRFTAKACDRTALLSCSRLFYGHEKSAVCWYWNVWYSTESYTELDLGMIFNVIDIVFGILLSKAMYSYI